MYTEQINEKAKERAIEIINLALSIHPEISIDNRIAVSIAAFKVAVLEDLEEDILCIAGDIDHISEAIAEGLEKIGKEIYWKNTN